MTRADRTSIVVGVDDSQTSMNAALWAADLAHRMTVPLVLAHAVMVPSYYAANVMLLPIPPMQGDDVPPDGRALLRSVSAAVAESFPTVDVSMWSQYGPADLALVGWSRLAQMVVVGAHRDISADSLVFGSTTSRVVNHSECPVAVWRGEAGSGPVVVGVDGSPLSRLAVEHAFEMASRYGVGLRTIHAWGTDRRLDYDARAAAEVLLAENLAGWQEKYPDVEVTRLAAELHPEEALREYSHDARLVVVGSHGRGRASSLFLGSTSRYLLRHSPCPVLVCREEVTA